MYKSDISPHFCLHGEDTELFWRSGETFLARGVFLNFVPAHLWRAARAAWKPAVRKRKLGAVCKVPTHRDQSNPALFESAPEWLLPHAQKDEF